MARRERLDVLLQRQGLVTSRARARALIMAGDVLVDGRCMDKPGMRIDISARLTLKARPRFVSRGGDKLAAALDAFGLDVSGQTCADVGASTGGFTDCLLQGGAQRVYSIDVGYGQLAWQLRQDERVVVMERKNARYIRGLPEPVSLVVIDVSFISLRLLLPVIHGWLTPAADVIVLIKPQFEAGRRQVGKGGVVRDPAIRREVLLQVLEAASSLGLVVRGLLRSPLPGPAGNIEFLAWLAAGRPDARRSAADIESLVRDVL